MNGWEFFYLIGCGVSFVMTSSIAAEENGEMPEEEQCFYGVMLTGLTFAVFSWAVPIFLLAYEIYKRGMYDVYKEPTKEERIELLKNDLKYRQKELQSAKSYWKKLTIKQEIAIDIRELRDLLGEKK